MVLVNFSLNSLMRTTLAFLALLFGIPALLMAQEPRGFHSEPILLDFKPLDGCVLTLKQLDKSFYLELDSADQHLAKYPIRLKSPESLLFDCMNAPYVITVDSVYQFTLNGGDFVVITAISQNDFNLKVRPCVAVFNDRAMFESFDLRDSTYEISRYSSNEESPVFTRNVAVELVSTHSVSRPDNFYDLQRASSRQLNSQDLVTAQAYYTGDLTLVNPPVSQPSGVSGFNAPFRTGRTGSQYSRSNQSYHVIRPLVTSLRIGNFVAVIDRGADSVFVLDHNGYLVSSKKFLYSGELHSVTSDQTTGEVYAFLNENNENNVYRLDPFTGSMLHIVALDSDSDLKKIRFYDGQMFFAESGPNGVSVVSTSMH